jgi:hypothetical protein
VNADVRAFLKSLSPEVREVVAALRRVVRRTIPQAEESIVWGSLSYHRPDVGGRVKGAVCLIAGKKGQVRLDFIHGIRLADPSRLLQGHQASKRYVPIGSLKDVVQPEILDLIREAALLDPTKWTEPQGRRPTNKRANAGVKRTAARNTISPFGLGGS